MIKRMCLVWALVLIPVTAFGGEEQRLSLEEALKIAVERNLDVQLQRITVNDREIGVGLADAQYEPTITGSTSVSTATRGPQTQQEGDRSVSVSGNDIESTFRKSEWFGFGYSVSFANDKSSSSADNAFGDEYGASLSFGFTQELLNGFSLDKEVQRNTEYVAESNLAIARQDLELTISNVLQQVEVAYWDLVSAIDQLKVNHQSRRLAQQLYDQNKIKIDVGTVAQIELVKAQADIARVELDIVRSEHGVLAAEDRLKKEMNLPLDQWDNQIVVTDELTVEEISSNLEMDFQTAIKNRPEMTKNTQTTRQAMMDLKVAKHNIVPKLTLQGGYTVAGQGRGSTTGTGENAVPVPPANSQAWTQIFDRELPRWNVSLNATWKPFNRDAKLRKTRAEIALRQAQVGTEQLQITLFQDVRNAIRDLESDIKSIKASEHSLKLQRENLKAEEQKFQNGLSTNYQVSQAQKTLSDSESALIQARVAYKKSVIAYYKSKGMLAKSRKINIR